jgi:hypothetical protein
MQTELGERISAKMLASIKLVIRMANTRDAKERALLPLEDLGGLRPDWLVVVKRSARVLTDHAQGAGT